MSYLYVSEQGASIGIEANRFQVKYKDGMIKSIPAETLEMIEVFGSVQITTRCLTECLKRGVNILFYSTSGAYYGRLISTSHVNVQRHRNVLVPSTGFLYFNTAFLAEHPDYFKFSSPPRGSYISICL
jgi:CRISPR/Cas system-associated endonuclease Cas1